MSIWLQQSWVNEVRSGGGSNHPDPINIKTLNLHPVKLDQHLVDNLVSALVSDPSAVLTPLRRKEDDAEAPGQREGQAEGWLKLQEKVQENLEIWSHADVVIIPIAALGISCQNLFETYANKISIFLPWTASYYQWLSQAFPKLMLAPILMWWMVPYQCSVSKLSLMLLILW